MSAALRADLREVGRIARHHAPRLLNDAGALLATVLFLAAFVAAAAMRAG